ncbi:MAG: allantoicase [Planctomycetota bacterium]
MSSATPREPAVAGALETLIDLANERVGGRALQATDEFFAPKERLVAPEKAVFVPGKFTDRGKWMDGWESRRRRGPGYDWCIVQLGIPGSIARVNLDTSHFKGNQPETFSIEACCWNAGGSASEGVPPLDVRWTEIVPVTAAGPDRDNFVEVRDPQRYTHVRLNIFPDGGVARLRVLGHPRPDWSRLVEARAVVDLAAVEYGGVPVAWNDANFGPPTNLLLPGRPVNMGDGWETRRRRGPPGHDWVILRLGHRGIVQRIEVDTAHFKGNYPESCSIDGCVADDDRQVTGADVEWIPLLPRKPLQADAQHFFAVEPSTAETRPVTHVRLCIDPDGGVGRLRVLGVPVSGPRAGAARAGDETR